MPSHYREDRAVNVQERSWGSARSYNQIVEWLAQLRQYDYDEASLKRMEILAHCCEIPASNLDIVLVGGTNGKSTTVHLTSKLLQEQGFKVGELYATHFLTYNERICINNRAIANKRFVELVNEVTSYVHRECLDVTAYELMLAAGLLYCASEGSDVVLIEVNAGGLFDPARIFTPDIAVLTRLAQDHTEFLGEDLDQTMYDMLSIALKSKWFISAEQSKLRLQKMKTWIENNHIQWMMPVRKLAPLPHIFEQLFGRCASLAERISYIYTKYIKGKMPLFAPTNVALTYRDDMKDRMLKEVSTLHGKTLKNFWAEKFNLPHGRFEYLGHEKPTILLDNAHNLDALDNVLLGIRLMHYQRALQGCALIIGMHESFKSNEIIKRIRYLFKKITGKIFFVTLSSSQKGHNPGELAALAQAAGLEAMACSFEEALINASKSVHERYGLVAICGSPCLVQAYWKIKGVKRLG